VRDRVDAGARCRVDGRIPRLEGDAALGRVGGVLDGELLAADERRGRAVGVGRERARGWTTAVAVRAGDDRYAGAAAPVGAGLAARAGVAVAAGRSVVRRTDRRQPGATPARLDVARRAAAVTWVRVAVVARLTRVERRVAAEIGTDRDVPGSGPWRPDRG